MTDYLFNKKLTIHPWDFKVADFSAKTLKGEEVVLLNKIESWLLEHPEEPPAHS